MIRPLILCVVLAGVAGADDCVYKLSEAPADYCGYVDIGMPRKNPDGTKWCPCPETTEKKLSKLEKRVAELERRQRIGGKLKANPLPCQPGGVEACVDSQRISNE